MTADDISRLERRTLKCFLSKFHVHFMFAIAFMSAVLFIWGLLWSFSTENSPWSVRDDVLLLAVGAITFSLSLPSFLVLYVGRHLLISVDALERQVAEMADARNQSRNGPAACHSDS